MKTVAIITPWKDHPELILEYAKATDDANVVFILGDGYTCSLLTDGLHHFRYRSIRIEDAFHFARVMNLGMEIAECYDIIVCLNNDIRAFADWIEQVREQVEDGALYGPAFAAHIVDGVTIPYIEGWCIAATRKTWNKLGGFDTGYERAYYEDADLSFRAVLAGMKLVKTFWPLEHLSNTTSKTTPGAYDFSARNRERFFTRVRCELGDAVIPETFKSGPPRLEFSKVAEVVA